MTKVHYYTATTLDGFLADPDDSLAWLMRQEIDEDGYGSYSEFIAGIGAIVMGSTTYEWVVEHLNSSGEKWMYEMPAWVMTTRDLEPFPGADIRFASGGVRAVYDEMVAAVAAGSASEQADSSLGAGGAQDIWIVGGGDLVGQFADEGLLDEMFVSIAPVVLGAGRPLLPRRYDFELLDTGRNGAFVCARYRFVGPLAEDE